MEADGNTIAECFLTSIEKHFGGFVPALNFLLESSQKNITGLRAAVVALGPGSFTGLRVGLSAAKGLCHGLGIPLLGISSLEALANQVPFSPIPVTPVIDSRKGEVFTAQFQWDGRKRMNRITPDACVRFEDLPRLLAGQTVVVGNNFKKQAPVLRDVIGIRAVLAPSHHWTLRASAIGHLGIARLKKGDLDRPEDLSPIYFRPPDIRPNPYPLLDNGRK